MLPLLDAAPIPHSNISISEFTILRVYPKKSNLPTLRALLCIGY